MPSNYLFTVCQVGAEPALKAEIKREHPTLAFAFSRPGFVTFKSGKPLEPDFQLKSVFTRAYGLSIGKSDLAGLSLAFGEARRTLGSEGKSRLHVWERDQYKPDEQPKGFNPGGWKRSAVSALKGVDCALGGVAVQGELVWDVVAVEENQFWIGAHIQSGNHHAWPGGDPGLVLPPEAPSRAYLKLEEALCWSHAVLKPGDVAVEIGSAPGGASYALLKRGLNVIGIDPAEMDRRVTEFKGSGGEVRFHHIRQPVASVAREALPDSVQWLLLDMNVAPSITLYQVDRLATRLKEGSLGDGLLGMILTLKLNEWKFAGEIPSMLEHVRAMGMVRVRATQLASNKQEICVVGLTRQGVVRVTSTPASPSKS